VLLELEPQALVVGAEDRLDVFGVERLGAGGEADEVGKENRHHLALAPRHAPSLRRGSLPAYPPSRLSGVSSALLSGTNSLQCGHLKPRWRSGPPAISAAENVLWQCGQLAVFVLSDVTSVAMT
jgi:hypothetical protein